MGTFGLKDRIQIKKSSHLSNKNSDNKVDEHKWRTST